MIAFLHGSRRGSTDQRFANRRFVRYWLYIVFLMLIVIVLVGGITRIMGAGLSITEWQPIHGIIPPYGQNQWDEEFLKYQQITQYQHLNPNMTLAEFKHIFWWEWVHRLLARAVGFLIALPMTFFWLTGRLEKMVKWRLVSILLLCFLQGFIGWWMVTSGLGRSQLVRVSQYRLAIHLVMGCVIITAVLALARGLVEHTGQSVVRSIQRFAGLLVVLAFFQIYLGALVAGLHAGRVYTTWPMMDGHFIPDGLLHLQPLWRICNYSRIKCGKTSSGNETCTAGTVSFNSCFHADDYRDYNCFA